MNTRTTSATSFVPPKQVLIPVSINDSEQSDAIQDLLVHEHIPSGPTNLKLFDQVKRFSAKVWSALELHLCEHDSIFLLVDMETKEIKLLTAEEVRAFRAKE